MTRSAEELLAAHLAGDAAAFGELVRGLSGLLLSVARGLLNSPEDADEAVQDALIRAHQRADTFRGDSSVTTWVLKILGNVCRDRHRHNRARPADPVPEVDVVADPRDPISTLETRLELWAALSALPPHQRLPVVLVHVLEYPVAEVARMLDLPAGTVKSRCSRGRAQLQAVLSNVEEVA